MPGTEKSSIQLRRSPMSGAQSAMAAAKAGSMFPREMGQQSFLTPVKQHATLFFPHFDSITARLSEAPAIEQKY